MPERAARRCPTVLALCFQLIPFAVLKPDAKLRERVVCVLHNTPVSKILRTLPTAHSIYGQNLMPVSELKYNLHDSHIAEFSFGPRREVTLTVALDPVWNINKPATIKLRFSAIENYEAVQSYFHSNYVERALPNAYWDEIQELSAIDKKTYRLILGSGIVDIVCKGYQEVH
ncbi:MAG: hypothetical protein JNL32_06995 [Candidatus Kapabacteria bacterium]|nr:hypothetical protein [Candidatus Kapabacteria bacterium]